MVGDTGFEPVTSAMYVNGSFRSESILSEAAGGNMTRKSLCGLWFSFDITYLLQSSTDIIACSYAVYK